MDYFLENIATREKIRFFDEVQAYPQWYRWIKSFFDRYKDVKLFISGSSSLKMQKEANIYLRERIIPYTLYPLDFFEFLVMCNFHPEEIKISDDVVDIDATYNKIKSYWKEYMLVGGLPEWFELRNMSFSVEKWFSRLIEDVPKKAFYEDILNIYNIKSPRSLELIFAFIAANQSRVLSYESINEIVRMDRTTLIEYIEFLKASYLIIEIKKYARNIKSRMKSKKKFLVIDQGIRNAMLKDYEVRENNEGLIAENIAGIYLHRICEKSDGSIYYWRNREEIDFILLRGKDMVPVEVKYVDDPKNQGT